MDHRLKSREVKFQLEEAIIDELHAAIRGGDTTCLAVVQHYLARVSAFNGVASVLGDASGKSAEQVTEEFASNSITGRFTRPDEVATWS